MRSSRVLLLFVAVLLSWPSPVAALPTQIAGARVLYADSHGQLDTWPVGPDDVRHLLRTRSETRMEGNEAVTVTFFEHVTRTATGELQTQPVAQWSSREKRPTTWAPLDTRVLPQGGCLGLAERFTPEGESGGRTEVLLLRDGQGAEVLPLRVPSEARLLVDDAGAPVVFARYGDAIEVWGAGASHPITSDTDYDWSVARDGSGRLTLVSYDREQRALRLHSAEAATAAWQGSTIDGWEAGWQHSLAARGDELVVLYYYYRNAFNKGLKVATLNLGAVTGTTTFRREREHNLGWEPLLGIRNDGSLRVSFLENVDEEERAEQDFASLEAMLAGHPEEVTGSWEDDRRFVEVEVGARPAFQWWMVRSPDPPAGDTTVRYRPRYHYDPGFVTSFFASGRIGSVHLGATYAQDLLADQVGDLGGNAAKRAYQLLSAQVGIDELFAGHDVRITWERADFSGTYDDVDGRRDAGTLLNAVEVALLNQWRMKYGLQFRTYDLTEPIYGYYAPANERAYTFVGADVVDADIWRLEAFVGYSRLDYLAKYETRFFGPVFDVALAGGLGVSTFPNIELGGHDVGTDVTFAFSGSARAALAYYQRFHALHGAGFHLSLGYQVWGLMHGFSTGRPEDRPNDSDDDRKKLEEESFVTRVAHVQLFHGPYLALGLVY
jgi:hypothetical protein